MTTLALRIALDALKDRKGISALEYAVLATAILAGLFTAAGVLNTSLKTVFSTTIPGLL